MTRGLKNQNPGNIRHGDPWLGLSRDQLDPDFCTFTDAKFGIRAMAVILRNKEKRGLYTVRAIISDWAPPNENDTASYIAAVAHELDTTPDALLNVSNYYVMKALIEAIIRHENGSQPYGDYVIDEALEMAGVTVPVSRPVRLPEVVRAEPASKPSMWERFKALLGRI